MFGPFIEQHDTRMLVLMHDVVVRGGGFVFSCSSNLSGSGAYWLGGE